MIPGIADLKDDGEKFKFDIQHRAANIDARSECYEKIPISDFGEGLLRGMGWGGSRLDSEEAHAVGRPARLGLGATPKPPSPPPEHRRIKKSGQVSTKGAVERALWEREVAKKLDSQKLEVGDVVWLKDPRFLRGSEVSRATVHRTSGVAGLNRIEVVLEAPDGQVATVLKTDAVLVDAKELAAKPFRASQSSSGKRQPTKGDASATDKRPAPLTDKRPAPLTDKRPRVEEADGKSNAHSSSSSSSSSSLWAVPRIRVRIVEKGARYDQLKGLVTKISEGRCTVLLDDGTEVKDLKEAALETVVPSVDDMVYVVAGRFRHAKGPILKKDRDREEVCLEIDGKRQYLRFDDVCSLAN
jgi:transcription antitermination factor NusG